MPERPVNNDEDDVQPTAEELLEEETAEEEYTISESDMVIDRDDYEEDEVEDYSDWEVDLAQGTMYNTQQGHGETNDPEEAWQQGLIYTPPTDPPTVHSEDPEGVEFGAGFAPSMEETNPDVEDLPAHVDNSDLDIEEDVAIALRDNSETMNLADRIAISVVDGVVRLQGTVDSDEDIAVIDDIVANLEGVVDVDNRLEVAGTDEWSLE